VSSLIWPVTNEPWYPVISRLSGSGRPLEELIGNITAVTVGASANHAHTTVNAIDFYLSDSRKKERDHIVQLVKRNDAESEALLFGYVCEAMRA